MSDSNVRRILSVLMFVFCGAALHASDFNSVANFNVGRFNHTQTTLLDGRILIAGGTNVGGQSVKSVEIYNPVSNTWFIAQDMFSARAYHTATLLPDGRVFVATGFDPNAGGPGNAGPVNACEIYDPVSDTWSAGPSLNAPRFNHTATLLANGNVLLIGGKDNAGAVGFAEEFNPSTGPIGAWTARSAMLARYDHTSTVLPNGKLLVVGGTYVGNAINAVEIYDPSNGIVGSAAYMNDLRTGHTSTLLKNGQVLVAGGVYQGTASSTAELYNPATNQWTYTSAGMIHARFSFTASLLPNGKVLVAGGAYAGNGITDAETYDPIADQWFPVGSLGTPRYGHAASLLPDGSPLITGGAITASAFNYAEKFTTPPQLQPSVSRFEGTATLLQNGKILFAGGYNTNNQVLNSTELYDIQTHTWTPGPYLSQARHFHTATMLTNGLVLIAGGDQFQMPYLTSSELYDPRTNTMLPAVIAVMNSDHSAASATRLNDGRVLLVGGGSNSVSRKFAEIYDSATNTWTPTSTPMTFEHQFQAAAKLQDGRVLIIGGNNSYCEIYDPVGDTWTTTGCLMETRVAHSATVLPNGKVLVIAGEDGFGTAKNTCELFDPGSNTWSAAPSIGFVTEKHSATLLPSGKVFLMGGFTSGNPHSEYQVYDSLMGPMGTWSPVANLPHVRGAHTATLLPDGSVMLNGGGAPLPDFYNTNAQIPHGTNTNHPHAFHTATVLQGGKVLIYGGNATPNDGASEVYDPASKTWTDTATPTHHLRTAQAGVLLQSGKVLMAGGTAGAYSELYDPATATWSDTGNIDGLRNYPTLTALPGGKALLVGGNPGAPAFSTTLIFDPSSGTNGTWSAGPTMLSGHSNHTATTLPDGRTLIVAGYLNTTTNDVELFDPVGNAFAAAAPIPTPRHDHRAVSLQDGRVLIVGGFDDSGIVTTGAIYNPTSNMWIATSNPNSLDFIDTATLRADGRVLVTHSIDPRNEMYDPSNDSWTILPLTQFPRGGATATLLSDNTILYVDGDNGGGAFPFVDIFDSYPTSTVQPYITTAVPTATGLIVNGGLFTGISEGSSGSAFQSPSNYPLVQLVGNNGFAQFLTPDPSTPWSDTSFKSTPLIGFVPGPARLTVFVNGIPSGTKDVVLSSGGNSAPTITDSKPAMVTMDENGSPTAFNLTLHATDPDAGDTLMWSVLTPASHGFAIVGGGHGIQPNYRLHTEQSLCRQ